MRNDTRSFNIAARVPPRPPGDTDLVWAGVTRVTDTLCSGAYLDVFSLAILLIGRPNFEWLDYRLTDSLQSYVWILTYLANVD